MSEGGPGALAWKAVSSKQQWLNAHGLNGNTLKEGTVAQPLVQYEA